MKKYHIDEKKIRYNTLSNIFLGIISVLAVAFLLLTFYPFEVIKPLTQPYRVITKVVKPGQQLIYQVNVCKYMPVIGTVSRTFVNDTTRTSYPALVSGGRIKTGCDITNISTDVPIYLPSGKYHLDLDIVYHVNVFNDKSYHFYTDSFIVKGGL